jgi:hypothetical protein
MITEDIVYEPEFTEDDGEFKVGQEVWARLSQYWAMGTVMQIRQDAGLKFSRYLIKFASREVWVNTVEDAKSAVASYCDFGDC